MFIASLCLITMFLACGSSSSKRAAPTINPIDVIIEKKTNYLERIKGVQDAYGFIHSDECDSLIFSGLIDYSGAEVDILAARNEQTGQWYRTPYQDCFRNEREDVDSSRRSKSTTSRDQLAGAMWSFFGAGDMASLSRIREYGQKNDWIMGDGPIDRVYFTPNFVDTLYRLLERDYKGPPYIWLDPIKDHQRHVVALNILLRGEKEQKIPRKAYDLLKKFLKKDPNNALFSYGVHRFSDGDQSHAISILLDESLFPDDLPAERCRRWLWEKESSSWKGCGSDTELATGGDFLFLATLLEDSKIGTIE